MMSLRCTCDDQHSHLKIVSAALRALLDFYSTLPKHNSFSLMSDLFWVKELVVMGKKKKKKPFLSIICYIIPNSQSQDWYHWWESPAPLLPVLCPNFSWINHLWYCFIFFLYSKFLVNYISDCKIIGHSNTQKTLNIWVRFIFQQDQKVAQYNISVHNPVQGIFASLSTCEKSFSHVLISGTRPWENQNQVVRLVTN